MKIWGLTIETQKNVRFLAILLIGSAINAQSSMISTRTSKTSIFVSSI